MKPYVLMLLIGTIAALSDLVGDKVARREPRQAPLIATAVRRIGRRLVVMGFAPIPRRDR